MWDDQWTKSILASIGLVSIALLGGVARLLHDHPDEETPITSRDKARYCACSVVSGIVLCIVIFEYYGFSILLFAVAAVAGFGAVQLLGLCVVLLSNVLKRIFPGSDE